MNRHDIFFLSGFLFLIIFMLCLYCKNKFKKKLMIRNAIIVPISNFELDNNTNNIPNNITNNNIPIINSHPFVPKLPLV